MIRLEAFLVVVLVSSDGLLKTRKNANLNNIVSSPLGSGGGGMIFVSSARQGGQLLNFKSKGGDTFRGEKMILGSQAGEGLLYQDELLIFPQNASL